MAKKGYGRKAGTVRLLLGPRGSQKRPGFAQAKAANKKAARGGGGAPGMSTIRGTGNKAPWMGDPQRGLRRTKRPVGKSGGAWGGQGG